MGRPYKVLHSKDTQLHLFGVHVQLPLFSTKDTDLLNIISEHVSEKDSFLEDSGRKLPDYLKNPSLFYQLSQR